MSQPGWLDWPPSSKTRILKPSARQRGFERFGWRPHWVIPIQLEYFVKIFFQPALLSSHHRSVLPSFPPHWDVLSGDVYQPRSWTPKSPSRVFDLTFMSWKVKRWQKAEGWKVFLLFSVDCPMPTHPKVCGPKVSKLSLFTKRQTAAALKLHKVEKSQYLSFSGDPLKLLREGASSLLPQCWNCKNLTTSPKNFSWKLGHIEIRVNAAAMWFYVKKDNICFSAASTRTKLFSTKAKITHKFHIPLQCGAGLS